MAVEVEAAAAAGEDGARFVLVVLKREMGVEVVEGLS